MTAPRDVLDPSRHSQFGKGPLKWSVPTKFGGLSASGQDQMLWDVRGALLQHEFALALNRALSKPRQTRLAFCAKWHYAKRRLDQVLRGEVRVSSNEVALVLRAFGPSALPEPSAVQASVSRAGQSARHVPGRKPGVLLRADGEEPTASSADQENVMVALGEEGGITMLPELTAEQEAAYARNAELARPLIVQAVKALRNAEPLYDGWDSEGDDNYVRVRAAYEMAGGKPEPVGGPDDQGSSLSVYLSADWCTKVHDAGLALIGGRFVLDVDGHGPDSRPTTALVIALAPEHGDWTRDEHGRLAEDDWEYVAQPAPLAWDEHGRPHIDA